MSALLLLLAALLWPARSRLPVPTTWPEPGEGTSEGVTTREVADATVLLAVALRSGRGLLDAIDETRRVLGPGAARDLSRVAAALRWGSTMSQAWSYARPVWRRTGRAFVIADESGAAAAEVLLEAAQAQREAESRRRESAGGRAGVLLVLPLGLCFLPAFVAIAVVPLVVVLLGQALG